MDAPRVVVVGAGPAGVRAAEALVKHGLRPLVIDEAPLAGGQIYRRPPPGFRRPAKELYGFEAAKAEAIHRTFDGLTDAIDYRPRTLAWNVQDRVLYTACDDAVTPVPFDALLLATGATDRVLPFPGWTLPGVFTLGGSQVALKHQGCAVGRRTVFLGSTPLLYLVAHQYVRAGAEVVAVLDTAPFSAKMRALPKLLSDTPMSAKGLYTMAALRRSGVPIEHGVRPVAAEGDGAVAGLRYRRPGGGEVRIDCDAVAFGFGLRPESQLADLADCGFFFDPVLRQWLPQCAGDGRAGDGVYLAGDGARIGGADAAEVSGELAALSLVEDLGRVPGDPGRSAKLSRRLASLMRFQAGLADAFPWPADMARSLPDEAIVCRCERVTAGEVRRAVQHSLGGGREINRAKALSRIGMGRCQGRFCGLGSAEVSAAIQDRDVSTVGRLRGAGPVKPIKLASLLEE
ncbi:MAG: NAD(P)/FAD-dependent oxidoreductase [Rhodospirillales bacterium]|nr:NAD(P)/FAD-dependent oxidoreductase [Rhodospirillales bacterium]MDP6884045.1 NAD(P)/FAD-dependent oxidoreductase [Rhodospirillales bacterium]